jgi:hypothetical protein
MQAFQIEATFTHPSSVVMNFKEFVKPVYGTNYTECQILRNNTFR